MSRLDYSEFLRKYQKEEVVEYSNEVDKNVHVSIVVPTYNHEVHIAECITSILNQKIDYTFEVIIGNDKSSDRTLEISLGMAEKNSNHLRLLTNSRANNIAINGRPTGRFNFIFSMIQSRGKYVALCDGDDYWTDPSKLQKQIDFLELNPEFNICAHVTSVKVEGKIEYDSQRRPNPNYIGRKLDQRDIVKMMTNDGPTFHTSSFVFRRESLTDIDIFSKVTVGDYFILLNLTNKGKAYVLPDEMSVYRKTNTGISHSRENNQEIHSKNGISFFSKMNTYTKGRHKELFNAKINNAYKGLLDFHINNKSLLSALIVLFKMMVLDRKNFNQLYKFKRAFSK